MSPFILKTIGHFMVLPSLFLLLCSCYPYMPQLIVMSTMDLPSVESADFCPTDNTFALGYHCSPIGGIFIVDLQGRVLRWLCKGTGRYYYRSPAFSPDGQQIAFCSDEGSIHSSIYIINIDGSNRRRLTRGIDVYDHSPVFSTDGKKIYFIRNAKSYENPSKLGQTNIAYKGDVWVVDLTSLQETIITKLPTDNLESVATSTDTNTLFVIGNKLLAKQHFVLKLDASKPANYSKITPLLPPLVEKDVKPSQAERYDLDRPRIKNISRDGKHMLFDWPGRTESNRDGGRQVYVTDMSTMQSATIGRIGDTSSFALAISANGQNLLVKKNSELRWGCGPVLKDSPLYLINRESGSVRNLTLDFTAIWDEIREVQRTTPPRR